MNVISSKVIVIGNGRFGNATAQGLRESFFETSDGNRRRYNVVQVSARNFSLLSVSDMADELQDAVFVVYCGKNLYKYAVKIASAIRLATKLSSGPALEFIDFSNPDPTNEEKDVSGAIDLWVDLSKARDEQVTEKECLPIKVWKITEVGSVDVSGILGDTDGLVYGSHPGEIPKINIRNLSLKSAGPTADLFEEARIRIHEHSGIDCWHDGVIMSLAIFVFTSTYAILRYDINVNGSEPHSNIPMYLLDKGFAWTGLWLMVVSPFAGNLLALGSIYEKWSNIDSFQKIVAVFCSLLMIIPTILFSVCWLFWIAARNAYFTMRWPTSAMYLSQSPDKSHELQSNWVKASLVDMVTLKGETGCVGFVYAFIHSFLGVIVCDVAYKENWFNVDTGRLLWNTELSMMTGAISTALLWAVTMRSIMGKASWIRLKPLYSYLSPIGIWFAVIHIMAFGAKGWNTLFNKNYHNGQMSITFVSSMYPTCVLLVHHVMAFSRSKKICSGDYLWKNSIVKIANAHFNDILANAGFSVDETLDISSNSERDSSDEYDA